MGSSTSQGVDAQQHRQCYGAYREAQTNNFATMHGPEGAGQYGMAAARGSTVDICGPYFRSAVIVER